MPFDYAKDNMERRPYEFYIEEYRQADPIEISNRLGIAYDVQKSEFIIFFMGVNYHVRAYRELPSGELYYRQFQGRCIFRLNRKYGNRLETMERIMDTLGAAQVHMADKGYELEIFENFYLRFLFWEGDEEFPASSQILFSSNFPAAFDAYDLAEVGEICINAFDEIEGK